MERRRGRHPETVTWSRYLEDDVGARERGRLEAHLRECAECRSALQSLTQTIDALRSLDDEVSPGRADAIIATLPATTEHRGGLGGEWRPRVGAALRYCVERSQLRFTLPIAVLVGVVLSVVNQGGMLFAGRIDVGMCATCALNFVLPFVAMNVVLLSVAGVAWQRR